VFPVASKKVSLKMSPKVRLSSVFVAVFMPLLSCKRRIPGASAAKANSALFASDDHLFNDNSGVFIASDATLASLAETWSAVEDEEANVSVSNALVLPAVCKDDEEGRAVGCSVYCKCGWGKQCYPKWVLPAAAQGGSADSSSKLGGLSGISKSGERVNVGICDTSISMLAVLSFVLFILSLIMFVALRTCVQWRAMAQAYTEEAHLKFQVGFLGSQAPFMQASDPLAQSRAKLGVETEESPDDLRLSSVPEADDVDEGWDRTTDGVQDPKGDADTTDVSDNTKEA